jgi:hypothetical protein
MESLTRSSCRDSCRRQTAVNAVEWKSPPTICPYASANPLFVLVR